MNADPTFWLLARGSGIAAFVLLWLSVVAGLTLSSRPFGRALPPALVTEVHRTLGLTGLVAAVIHAGALVADATVHVSPLAVFVPGLVDYRSAWTAFGVLAFDLVLVLQVSFALRSRIGVRRWRRLHYVSFLTYALAAAHGVLAGSDSGLPWMFGVYVVSVASVVGLTAFRFTGARKPRRRPAPRPDVARPIDPTPKGHLT